MSSIKDFEMAQRIHVATVQLQAEILTLRNAAVLATERAEKAEAEVADYKAKWYDSNKAVHAAWNRAEKAEAERDALRQDAARYRWLRDGAECDVIFGDPEYEDRYAHVESLLALDDLDAAIDAALKEGKP